MRGLPGNRHAGCYSTIGAKLIALFFLTSGSQAGISPDLPPLRPDVTSLTGEAAIGRGRKLKVIVGDNGHFWDKAGNTVRFVPPRDFDMMKLNGAMAVDPQAVTEFVCVSLTRGRGETMPAGKMVCRPGKGHGVSGFMFPPEPHHNTGPLTKVFGEAFNFPQNISATDVWFGLADVPWTVDLVLIPPKRHVGNLKWNAAVQPGAYPPTGKQFPGTVHVRCTIPLNFRRQQINVVAYDRHQRQLTSTGSYRSEGGELYSYFRSQQNKQDGSFKDISPSEVAKVKFMVRPYKWFLFRNVALRANDNKR